MKKKTLAELEAMKAELEGKNTYMHLFKNEDTLKKETIREKQGKNQIFVYDQAKRDEEDRGGYCQKCARESVWCKDRKCREQPKGYLGAPLASSQVYGWRAPIDDMKTNFNRSGVCKRTFFDKGHL